MMKNTMVDCTSTAQDQLVRTRDDMNSFEEKKGKERGGSPLGFGFEAKQRGSFWGWVRRLSCLA